MVAVPPNTLDATGEVDGGPRHHHPKARERRALRHLLRQLHELIAGSLGFLALVVSAYTVYVLHQQLKVTTWPRLMLEGETKRHEGTDEIHLVIALKNRGVAPAEVRSFRVEVDGQRVSNWFDWLERLKARQSVKTEVSISAAITPTGHVIGVGQEMRLFVTDALGTAAIIAADESTTVSLCYCSVLDDCWTLVDRFDGAAKTEPVAHCPDEPRRFVAVPSTLHAAGAAGITHEAP